MNVPLRNSQTSGATPPEDTGFAADVSLELIRRNAVVGAGLRELRRGARAERSGG